MALHMLLLAVMFEPLKEKLQMIQYSQAPGPLDLKKHPPSARAREGTLKVKSL